MTTTAESLKVQLEQLSQQERAELACFLIGSLEAEADPEAEAAWDWELDRRGEEILSGRAAGEPAASVFARLRARYS